MSCISIAAACCKLSGTGKWSRAAIFCPKCVLRFFATLQLQGRGGSSAIECTVHEQCACMLMIQFQALRNAKHPRGDLP